MVINCSFIFNAEIILPIAMAYIWQDKTDEGILSCALCYLHSNYIMKAIAIREWGTPQELKQIELENPIPKADQILIKVFASGINPVDWKQRKGNHKYILGAPFPIVLGYDVCGEVVEVGQLITAFKPGDIVFGDLDNTYGGALAELALGHENCFAIKPNNISIEEASAVTLAGLTALQALRNKGKIKPDSTVVINGASGGVGHLALQIAKILGAKTIAISGSNSKPFVNSYNPDKYVNYNQEDILKSDIAADIFFDVAGNQSFLKTKHLLKPGGVYVSTLPRPKILLHKLIQPFTSGKKVRTLLRKKNSDDLHLIAKWLEEGKLKVNIDKVFKFNEANLAHEHAEKGNIKGKVVVSINS